MMNMERLVMLFNFFKPENDETTVTFRLEFPIPLTPRGKFENLFFEKENIEPQFDYSL